MTRRDSEARRQAIYEFFLKNPGATGDEAQAALRAGKLAGIEKGGPAMSIGQLYALRRKAAETTALAAPPVAPTMDSGPALAELREAVRRAQAALAKLPDVSEVHITRSGARLVRLTPREEPL